MLSSTILFLLTINAGVYSLPTTRNFTTRQAGESHQVTLVNNCGSGQPVFTYEGHTSPSGSTLVSGQLRGGIAWMSGMEGINCLANGVNCGVIEFTLVNPKNNIQFPEQNSADYSLLNGIDKDQGTSLGDHNFQYSMDFAFTGGCTEAPGVCTGNSAEQCPGAYLGSETAGGAPTQCLADNVGITITFGSAGGAPAGGGGGAPANTATVPGNSIPPAESPAESPSVPPVDVSSPSVPPAAGPPTSTADIPQGDPAKSTLQSVPVTPVPSTNVPPTVPPTIPPVGVPTSSRTRGGWGHWTRALE